MKPKIIGLESTGPAEPILQNAAQRLPSNNISLLVLFLGVDRTKGTSWRLSMCLSPSTYHANSQSPIFTFEMARVDGAMNAVVSQGKHWLPGLVSVTYFAHLKEY